MSHEHTHDYKQLTLQPITKIDNPNYNGTAGDKAFLVYLCKCGDKMSVSYGSYDSMHQKYLQIQDFLKSKGETPSVRT